MTTTHSISPETRATTSIALIAQREITTRVRTRSFVATTAILMIVIIAGLIVWSVFSGGGDSKERIGLVGNDSTLTAAITAVGDRVAHRSLW